MMTKAEENFKATKEFAFRSPSSVEEADDGSIIRAKWVSIVDHVSYVEIQFNEDGRIDLAIKIGSPGTFDYRTYYDIKELFKTITFYREML